MQQRKIPTPIGIILVILSVLMFRYAFNSVTPLLSRAKTTHAPQQVTISNITDTTFTVSWITREPATGAIILEGTPDVTIADDRQTMPGALPNGAWTTHHVTARNLKADTSYSVRILSGGKPYGDNASPYHIRTAPSITGTGSDIEPAYGQVTLPTNQPAEGAILYLTPKGAQTLSVLVKSSGSWVIPLNLIRTADLSAYLPRAERIDESIIVRHADGEATALTDTLNDNPVPAMTIGKSYDFRKIQAMATPTRAIALAQTPPAKPTVLSAATSRQVAIVKPQQNAAIASNLPLIQGTGVPGKTVSLLIGITKPISASVTVGADGVWYFTPPKPLADGKQSVTITTTDANGKPVALTHTFQILKSGTQVLGEATPSATLTPSPTISLQETPTPTATLAGEPIPITGSPLPLLLLLILGFGLVTGGVAILAR